MYLHLSYIHIYIVLQVLYIYVHRLPASYICIYVWLNKRLPIIIIEVAIYMLMSYIPLFSMMLQCKLHTSTSTYCMYICSYIAMYIYILHLHISYSLCMLKYILLLYMYICTYIHTYIHTVDIYTYVYRSWK